MNLTAPAHSMKLLVAGLVIAIAGTLTLSVYAQPMMAHGHGGYGGAPMDMPFGGRMVERMLDIVKATDAQRTQVKQIAQAAAADLRAQHEADRGLHDQMRQLFTQPTVDANAAEALRQKMLAAHDQSSKRMMQAMLDVSRVLTPEQRKTFADHMAQRREMMQRHMREHQQLEGAPPKQ